MDKEIKFAEFERVLSNDEQMTRNDIDKIIERINIQGGAYISLDDRMIIEREHDFIHLLYTTEDQPFSYIEKKHSQTLYINPDYYSKNRAKCDEEIIKIITNSQLKNINTPFELTDNIAQAIANHSHIKEIDIRETHLTKRLYEILMSNGPKTIRSGVIDPSLEEIFDGSILKTCIEL